MDTLYAKGPHLIEFCSWDSQYVFVVIIDLALRCKLPVRVALICRYAWSRCSDTCSLIAVISGSWNHGEIKQCFVLSGLVTRRTAFADLWGSWIPLLGADWLEMSKCFQMHNDSASPDDNTEKWPNQTGPHGIRLHFMGQGEPFQQPHPARTYHISTSHNLPAQQSSTSGHIIRYANSRGKSWTW